jgi:hypothetical protein
VATKRCRPARRDGRERPTLFGSTHSLSRKPMTVTPSDLANIVLCSMGAPRMGRNHGYTTGS